MLLGSFMEVSLNLLWLLIALGMAVAWRARWLRPRQRRVHMFRCPALTLWALWALSGACLASETAIPPTLQLPTAPSLRDQGIAVGDLDGDSRPDLAIVRPEGLGPQGFQYRIELDLTTRAAPTFFSVSAERGGLRIFPRDVNGDGYLDLVITSAWSLAPVGVWINDGRGGFTEHDPAAYPRSIWTESSGISSNTPQETLQASVPQSYRTWLDFSLSSYLRNELIIDHLLLLPATDRPSGPAVSRPSTRGPPLSLPQLPS